MSYLTKNSNSVSKNRTKTAIHLDDVTLTLNSAAGEVKILRGLSFDINKGESVGIVGPSGGGKSTMMMVVAGLEQVTSGTIKTAGVDLSSLDEDELACFRRENIGIVFQDFHLIPTMTAQENVAVPLEFSGIKNANDLAKEQLKAVGLDHRLTHYPSQLSGGEQQRASIARALLNHPEIILADEPTGNLDPEKSAKIIELLKEINAKGTTILIATHDYLIIKKHQARTIKCADQKVTEVDPQTL